MSGEWLAQLPDDLKTNEAFTSHATIGDFAKAHLAKVSEYEGKVKEADGRVTDLTKRLENAVFMPGKDAKPEEVAAFYQKLGRPENVDGYEINKPADLPDGVPFDEAVVKSFKDFAHQEGIPKQTAEKLFNWYYGLVKNGYDLDVKNKKDAEDKALAENAKVQQAAVDTLKAEWKDQFDGNIAKAVIGFKTFAKDMPEAEKLLDVKVTDEKLGTIRLGDHPVFNRLFYTISKSILSDSALSGREGGTGGTGDEDTVVAKKMFPDMNK